MLLQSIPISEASLIICYTKLRCDDGVWCHCRNQLSCNLLIKLCRMYCQSHFIGFCVLHGTILLHWNFEYTFRENANDQATKMNSLCTANHASFNLRVLGVEKDTDTTDTFSGIA